MGEGHCRNAPRAELQLGRTAVFSAVALILLVLLPMPARACQCALNPYPDWNDQIRDATLIGDYVVERLRPTKYPWTKIATARMTRAVKGAKEGDRIKISFGDSTSCGEYIPQRGTSIRQDTLLLGKDGIYFRGPCFRVRSPEALEAFTRERARVEAAAAAEPNDLEAQIALISNYNFWNEPKLALAALKVIAKRFPGERRLDLERATAFTALSEIAAARKAAGDTYLDPRLRGRYMLLILTTVGREAASGGRGLISEARKRIHLSFGRIQITGSDVSHTVLRKIHLSRPVEAAGSDWTGSQLNDVGLDRAEFARARLVDVRFEKVDLNGADLSEVDATGSVFVHARLSGADLHGMRAKKASFLESTFRRADLSGADVSGGKFIKSDLVGARLDGADLTEAVLTGVLLQGASLKGAVLRRADLSGADLTGANLSGTELAGARFDCRTRWPEGFDPATHELVTAESCGK